MSYELSSHEKTRRKLKWLFLNERSLSGKAESYTVSTIWYSGKEKTMGTVIRFRGCQGVWGRKRDQQAEHRGYWGQSKYSA